MSSSDSVDSDEGIRFKTDNVRNKSSSHSSSSSSHNRNLKRASPKREYKYGSSARPYSRGGSPKRHSKSEKSRSQNVKESRHSSNHSRDSNSKRDSDNYKSSSRKDSASDRTRSKHRDKYHSRERTYESSSHSRKRSRSPHSDKFKSRETSRAHPEKTAIGEEGIGPALPPRLQKKLRNIEDDSDSNSDSSDKIVGPALPPKIEESPAKAKEDRISNLEEQLHSDNNTAESEERSFGPVLPPNSAKGPSLPSTLQKNPKDKEKIIVIGPALPPNLQQQHLKSPVEDSSKAPDDAVGPILPPHLRQQPKKTAEEEKEEEETMGPVLPPNFQQPNESPSTPPARERIIGPYIPPHLQETLQNDQPELNIHNQEELEDCESDEEVIGPLPSNSGNLTKTQRLLEERALEMKLDKINPKEDDKTIREEWMLELPQVQASNLGFGPRQFRKNAAPDLSDRTSWTDTPEEKEAKKKSGCKNPSKKVNLKREAELVQIHTRDKEQEKVIEKLKKKKNRDKSLLDLHQDKLKKKKKETITSNERRPFNRETDLQVNKFDEAQKKAVFKKAQLLDTRFSSGESKFL